MKVDVFSPGKGIIKELSYFPDEVISNKDLGDGFLIELSDNNIYSPFDATVKVLYPTGHAVCLESDDGVQVMLHIGADTYKIQGINNVYANVGARVKQGERIIKTNVKELLKKTGSVAMAVVFLNKVNLLNLKGGIEADKDTVVATIEKQNV